MCLVFGGNGVVYLAEVLDVQDVPPAPSLVDPLPLLRHVLILILDGRSLAVGQPGGGENVQLDEGEHQHWLGLAMMRLIRMIFILLRSGFKKTDPIKDRDKHQLQHQNTNLFINGTNMKISMISICYT